eukprot:NODE_1316_length_1009_cov_55.968750_g1014_i0.p1 GENE.NODE_1316_length_1009_cov_55.968750_g1014_i0~~NODE_1316_length_1009_cov_55.968750_g1014_i0.p1  ORF type:complete len:157 (+),score=26.78 NODE_1316_length_1009_cov_55.968750_g1014_i0:62-532(+)
MQPLWVCFVCVACAVLGSGAEIFVWGIPQPYDWRAESAKLRATLHWPDVQLATSIIFNGTDSTHLLAVANSSWLKPCHKHLVDDELTVLEGQWAFRVKYAAEPVIINPGSRFITPHGEAHEESIPANAGVTVALLTWSPAAPAGNTIFLHHSDCYQ